MALSPFDFDNKAGNAVMGGQAASAGMGTATPGLQVRGGFSPSVAAAQAAQQSNVQNVLASLAPPQQQAAPATPTIGFNPQTRQVFSGGKVFNIDDVAMSSTAVKNGLLDFDNKELPPGFEAGDSAAAKQYIMGRMQDTSGTHAGDLWVDLKKGVQQLPGTATGIVDAATGALGLGTPVGDLANAAGKATGFTPGDWAQDQSQYSAGRQNQNIAVNNAWKESPAAGLQATLSNPGRLLGMGVQSAPGMIAGGVIGRGVSGLAGLSRMAGAGVGEGAVMAGQSMEQMMREGADPQRAGAAALGIGAVGAGVGIAGGAFARSRGVTDIDTLVAGGSAGNATAPLWKRGLTGGASEMFEEMGQSAPEQMLQNWAQYKPIMEGVPQATAEGGLVGFGMGGAFQMATRQGHQVDLMGAADAQKDQRNAPPALPAPQAFPVLPGVPAPSGLLPPPAGGAVVPYSGGPSVPPSGGTPQLGVRGPGSIQMGNENTVGATGPSEAEQRNSQMWQQRNFQSAAPGMNMDMFSEQPSPTHDVMPAATAPAQEQPSGDPYTHDMFSPQVQLPNQQAPQQGSFNLGDWVQPADPMGRQIQSQKAFDIIKQKAASGQMLTPFEHAMLRTGAPDAPTLPHGPGVFAGEQSQQRGFELSGNPTPQFDATPNERPDFQLESQTPSGQGELNLEGGHGDSLTSVPVHYGTEPKAPKKQKAPKQGEMSLHPEGVNGAKSQALYDRAARVMDEDGLAQVVSQLQAGKFKAAEKDVVKAEEAAKNKAALAPAAAPAPKTQTVGDKLKEKQKAKKQKSATPAEVPTQPSVAQQLGATNASPDQEHADAADTETATGKTAEGDAEADKQKPAGKGTRQKAGKAKEKVADAAEPEQVAEEAPAPEGKKDAPKRSSEVDDAEESVADEKEYTDLPDILDEVERLSNAADLDILEKKDRAILKNRLNYLISLANDESAPEHIRQMAQEAVDAAPKDLVNEVKRQQDTADKNREHRSEQRARDNELIGKIADKLYLSPKGRKIVQLIKSFAEHYGFEPNQFRQLVQFIMQRRWDGKPVINELMPAIHYLEERLVDAREGLNSEGDPTMDGLDPITGARSLKMALQMIARNPDLPPAVRLLAQLLLRNGRVLTAKLSILPEIHEREGGKYRLGNYDPDEHHVRLYAGAGIKTVLHEAVHAALVNSIKTNPAFKAKLQALYDRAAAVIGTEHYGMTDLDEFLAETLTDGKFQSMLDDRNLLQKFFDWVRDTLRIPSSKARLIDEILQLANDEIEGPEGPDGGPGKGPKKTYDSIGVVPKAAEILQQQSEVLKGSKTLEHKLNWMTLRQIKEKFSEKLRGLGDYIDEVFARASSTTDRINKLTPIAEKLDAYRKKSADLENLLLAGDQLEVDVRPDAPGRKSRTNAKSRWDASLVSEEKKAERVAQAIRDYDAMSDEAKKLYGEIRDFFDGQAEATHKAMVNMITTLIRDPIIRRARLADLNKWYANRVAGYFPHMRFGDHIVSYTDAEGERVVEMYESEREAFAAMREAKAEGMTDVTKRRKGEVVSNNFDLINDLTKAVDTLEIGDAADAVKRQMKDVLQEVYMKNLPEFSGAKFRLRRSNTKGYSKDVVRAMAAQGSRMSRHISRMEHMPEINAALAAMNDARTGKPYTYVATWNIGGNHVTRKVNGKSVTELEGGTWHSKVFANRLEMQQWMRKEGAKRKAQDAGGQMVHQDLSFARIASEEDAKKHFDGANIPEAEQPMAEVKANLSQTTKESGDFSHADTLYNHIKKLNELDGQQSSEVINGLTQAAWVYHLGLTPSFAIINLLQTPAMHTPWLASRAGIGMGKAFKHTMAAYGKVFRNLGDLAKATWHEDVLSALEGKLSAGELEVVRAMMRRNLIDFTTSYDLTAMAEGGAGAVSDLKRKALKVSSYAAQYSEVMNRLVTTLSTYNAAIEAGRTVEAATKLTEQALAETQGDYSPENTAYAMDRRRNSPLALMFQFQKYRQFVLYGLIDNFKKAFKGDKEAMQLLGGWLVSNGALFGAVGLPAALPILWVLSALTKDDDEPVDIQLMLKRWYTAATGSEKMAEVMTHGALRTIGISVTGRAGMGDIIPGTHALLDPKQMPEKDRQNAWATFFADTFAGAAGGIFNNMFSAAGFFADGQVLRGVEAMAPKGVKDVMASVRFYNEGVMNRAGTQQLADQVSLDQAFIKAIGFTPATVANLYEKRGSLLAIEAMLNNGQTKVKHAFVRASLFGDQADVDEAMDKWMKWNDTHPGKGSSIPYSALVQARTAAMKQEQALMASGGLYSSKQSQRIAAQHGLE